MHQGWKKEELDFTSLYRYDLHLKNFEKMISDFFKRFYASWTVGPTSYLVIAVYRPPGLKAKSFFDHFAIHFDEKGLQFDKIFLLGDCNVSLNVNNNASKIWKTIFEDFSLTQFVSEKTHRSGGILDHVFPSNNISINVKWIASLLLQNILLFVSRSAVWNNANLNKVCCIEIGRSLTLKVLLSYWSRA